MDLETLFSIASGLALLGWILLIISFWKNLDAYIIGIIVTSLALLYVYLIFSNFKPVDFASFNSLKGVKTLFGSDQVILAGWVHYLAFDLMTGLFIKNNSQKNSISVFWVIPCLFFTFMLGPCGLLFYLLIRLVKTKKYFLAFI